MWEARAETETDAAPEAIWALWEDPGRWKEWNREIASVKADAPLAEGVRVRVRLKRSPPQRFTVTSFEPNRVFVDETRLPGARFGHEHRIADGRIVHRLYLDGPLEKLWAALLGWRLRSAVRSFPEREAELASRPRPGRGPEAARDRGAQPR